MTIEHVSDTARWVAVYRAMESERPDALFRDPYARRLAGAKGFEIVRSIPRGRATAWALIVRTAVFDKLLRDAVERGVDTVVNLAAGLDARPWRMDLPTGLRWVDVDLPGILDYKLAELSGEPLRCDYRAVRADLTDSQLRRLALAEATNGSARAVVLSEGLLIYLTDEDVGALGRDLHATGPIGSWLTDLVSPRLLGWMQRSWGRQADRGNATFRFAPPEGTAFFEPLGWREVEYYSQWEEAHRLGRDMPMAWLWRFLGRFQSDARREQARRMSGIVRLDR
jgi:methyltransferase (TIGR00027 family)